MNSQSSLTFSFCGDNDVNALAVSDAIKSLVELSTAIHENEYPDVEFRLTVRAVNPGSLEFVFSAIALAAGTLFSPENISYAANMIAIMSAAFSVKKFLAGKNPKKVEKANEKITVTNAEAFTKTFPVGAGVYFVDSRVDRSVTNIIYNAKLSEGVTGISIDANGKVEISRSEFEDCSKEIDAVNVQTIEEPEPIVSTRNKEVLFIRQADFSGDLKWRFKGVNDENITASVLDDEFLDRVKSGEQSICATTYLVADLKIIVHIGTDGKPDDSRCSYEITKVHSVMTPGKGQTKFDV